MRPRLCFVGPMVGRNPGFVTTQGEKLADLFGERGHQVIAVSSSTNRYVRLADISATLWRRRRDIDVAIVEVYSGASFVVTDVASTITRALGIPTILSLHGGGLPEFMERHPRWTGRVLGRGQAIVSQSGYLARAVAGRGLRAAIIPNVLDFSRYRYRERASVRPRLFWMRAFHPVYNPEMAVRVLARLRARHADATLAMAGPDKGLQASTERLAEKLQVADAVRFPGFLDHAGKQREADAADVFINTNRVDNWPVAVAEAAAMGLPVVATRVGGLADLLDDERNGLLVPDGDDAAMAAAIERLVGDDGLSRRLSSAGPALAEPSAPGRVAAAWDNVIQGVLSRRLDC